MSERRFDESEIGPLLQRASELQAGIVTDAGAGMTLGDVQRVAAEVGIDPVMVERAASELNTRPMDPVSDERATSILLDQTVSGVLDEDAWEEIVAGLRNFANKRAGTIRQRGQTSEWVSDAGGVTFSATRRDAQTRFRLIADLSIGVEATLGMGAMCLALSMAVGASLSKHVLDPAAAIAVSTAIFAAGIVGGRFAARAWARRARIELRALFERATRLTNAAPDPMQTSLPAEDSAELTQRLG
ncbi:MAG: hypothetical protein ACYC96_06925 [Fimbriimonadaceae bacterium]